jgi:tRNA-Thr(GGU) m(6)t(6)A37 methyltransferase TsaA
MATPEKLSNLPDEISGSMTLRTIGIVRNGIKEPFLTAGDSDIEMQGEIDTARAEISESYQMISEIIIGKDIINIIDGIEEYSHLVVLYWAHKVPEQSRRLTRVHPMGRKEIPLSGVFCTCSPARPNPVLMSIVRLCKRERNVLQVIGLDAIDGSPVVDIKPYVREFYPQKEVRTPEWMQKLCREMS